MGQILDTLDELKLAKNTMVIFSSDNGPENTWKDRIKVYQHRSNGIYRDGKRSRYEGGHRVPFLVRWPAKIAAGSKCVQPVCQTDWLATFAEMLGVELPKNAGEDSDSFYAVFTNDDFHRAPMIHHSAGGEFAVRSGEWKLIVNDSPGPRSSPSNNQQNHLELYNLDSDPSETINLATQHPDRVRQLESTLKTSKQNPTSLRFAK